MRAVEAMVSTRDGWSNQETLSEASLSPRSIRDALGALRDLEGLTLKVPLDDVTAWRNSWYCAAETFFWDPSSSSSSEIDLSLTFSSVFRAAEKSTGEASLVQDSEERGRSSNGRSWTSGISGLVHPFGTSVWSPGMPDWSPGSSRWSLIMSGRQCLINRPGLGVWSCHTRVHPSLHGSPHWHKVN